jgi:uncharacterized cupredoxin-like copper-binding protein
MFSSQMRSKRSIIAVLLFAVVQGSAAAESDRCQALGFTGPVCSDCDMLASYVKDDGALVSMRR